MVKITQEMIRKKAEHNEGEIFSLEELTLHQQDIEKIEHLDKWCRDLQILYLQNNLIPKIENLSRLKKLRYLNLALNNIERLENLRDCESLQKLDLTVNFIGILTSISALADNEHLEELFLTGNPCTDFVGYREFVIASLPQLKHLDGVEIKKSEQILALQNFSRHHKLILAQQHEWLRKRSEEKENARERKERREEERRNNAEEFEDVDPDEDPFWKESVPFSPESRMETHEFMQEKRAHADKRDAKKSQDTSKSAQRNLFAPDGRPYNVNETKIDFKFWEEESAGRFVLDVPVYKYLDTELLSCDVQSNYVRVTLKGKILQLALPDEVNPDRSKAERSITTGHLVITMPKFDSEQPVQSSAGQSESPPAKSATKSATKSAAESATADKQSAQLENFLEIPERGQRAGITHELQTIVQQNQPMSGAARRQHIREGEAQAKPANQGAALEKPPSSDFMDDPEVPPLE